MTLEELRQRLTAVDRELIALIADRQRVVAEIGAYKIENAASTRDYEREREVLKGAREQAAELGVDADFAERIMRQLIEASLTSQEQSRVEARTHGRGQRALIIGGAGKMGGWFAHYLASQGYEVVLADPATAESAFPRVDDWRDTDTDHDLIVVATPIQTAADVLGALAERRPQGLVVDIGSLKTPLRGPLDDLVRAGCRVASIHPMFGPATRLLSGRHVIFVDIGAPEAAAAARQLFTSTMAELVDMGLEEHDRLIAYVLGLAHASNLAFFTALAESGELVPKLHSISSETFDAQLDVAALVARDNPHLYFEIQSLNDFGAAPLAALRGAAAEIERLVAARDERRFVDLMTAGRRYLESRR